VVNPHQHRLSSIVKELMHLLICEANALFLTEGYFTKIVLLICKYNSLSQIVIDIVNHCQFIILLNQN
jgi:hypothetical protein